MLCAVNAGGNAQCKRVADPDEGGREAVIQTLRREGGVVLKNFSAFESQFDPKIEGAGSPGPSPGPATAKQSDHLKKPVLRKVTVCFRSLVV